MRNRPPRSFVSVKRLDASTTVFSPVPPLYIYIHVCKRRVSAHSGERTGLMLDDVSPGNLDIYLGRFVRTPGANTILTGRISRRCERTNCSFLFFQIIPSFFLSYSSLIRGIQRCASDLRGDWNI